ncbi:MAG: uL15 family ribosomal protein, partial [Candidatus Paceibacteria bacterium]
MQLHEIKPIHKFKNKKRIGRGGKRGTYSGRGIKGQRARAGRKLKDMEREAILRIPKRRGIKFKPVSPKPAIVKLGDLNKIFDSGQKITPRTLLKKGLIHRFGKKLQDVKILAEGKLEKSLVFIGVKVSKGAKAKIEKAVPILVVLTIAATGSEANSG